MFLKVQINGILTPSEIKVNPNDVLYSHMLANNWTDYTPLYNRTKLDVYCQIRFLNLVNHCTINLLPIINEQVQINISFNDVIHKLNTTTKTTFRNIALLITSDPVQLKIQNTVVSLDTPCQLPNLTRIVLLPIDNAIPTPKPLQQIPTEPPKTVEQLQQPIVEHPVPQLTLPEDSTAPLNRNIQIYKPQQQQPHVELKDDFFTLSSTELKYILEQQQSYLNKLERPLTTQSMRDKELANKLQNTPRTSLRFMMPDQYVIEIQFWSTETMANVYAVLDTVLLINNYELIAVRTRYERSEEKHLFDLHLSPASLLHVRMVDKVDTIKILRDEYKHTITTETSLSSLANTTSHSSTSIKEKSEKLLKKVPKWFKMGNNK